MKNATLLLLLLSFSIFGQNLPFDFDAKKIIVLSDADFAATALSDGKIKKTYGVEDSLTIINWADDLQQIKTTARSVSNAAFTWDKVMEVSPDGKYVFVVETKERGYSDKFYNDIKAEFTDGFNIYAIEVGIGEPKEVCVSQAGVKPLSIDLNNAGDRFVITSEQVGGEISLVEWKNGLFDRLFSFPHGMYTDQSESKKVRATDATWHPTDKYIAVTLEEAGEIAFFEVQKNEEGNFPILELWGTVIKVDGKPTAGRFTQDGKHYIIPSINEIDKPSELVVIAFDDKNGLHNIASKTPIAPMVESFCIDPNSSHVAVASTQGSNLPYKNANRTASSAITLLSFDKETGALKLIHEAPYLGVMPKGLSFDKNGDMLVVTSFEYNDLFERKGAIEFWNIVGVEKNKKLENTGIKLNLTRGAHAIKVIH